MNKIDKRRSIGFAAKEVGIPEHTLRFWETQFPQIKPVLGRGKRRYYFDKDIDLLQKIKYFLHHEGYTIRGLQKLFESRKDILKKELNEIKNIEGIGINVKKMGKDLSVDTVCKLMDCCNRLKIIIKKSENWQ
jgi:DNA-binding transcriptional MerR regulator